MSAFGVRASDRGILSLSDVDPGFSKAAITCRIPRVLITRHFIFKLYSHLFARNRSKRSSGTGGGLG